MPALVAGPGGEATNPPLVDLLGLPGDAGFRLLDHAAPADAEGLSAAWREGMAGSRPFRLALRLRLSDGTLQAMRCELTPLPGYGWLGTLFNAPSEPTPQPPNAGDESYRLLAEHATDLITRHDAGGHILFASQAAARILSIQPRELIGRHFSTYVHPNDRASYSRFLALLRERQGSAMLAYRVERADGSMIWVETSGEVRCMGEQCQYTCVTRDISLRKRAEHELLQVQRQLSTALESMECALAMYGPDDRLVLCNNRYRMLLPQIMDVVRPGVHYDEILAAVAAEVVAWNGRSGEWQALRKHAHDNPTGQARVERTGKDSWAQVTDFPTSEGGVVTLVTDVSQIKRVEEQLNKQTLLLTSLLDSITDLIFYKDRHGIYIGCNPAFCDFVGRKRETIVGKTDFDIFPEDIARFFQESDRMMMEAQVERRNEEWVPYPDGRLVLLETLKSPIRVGDSIEGLVGISRDITERHQAESLLRAESSRLATLIQSMEGGVLVEDDRRRVHLVNRVFLRLFDILGDPDDFIGADCEMALQLAAPHFARPAEVLNAIEALMQGNLPVRSIIIEMRGQRFLECDFSPIAVGANTCNYLWHYRDITSRRRAELELQQRDVMLRGLADTVRQLLAGLDDFDNCIIEAFRIIADTAHVDGVRIFENHSGPEGHGPAVSQRYFWSRFEGAVRRDERMENIPVEPFFSCWHGTLLRGSLVIGDTASFGPAERQALEQQHVGSLLMAPLFHGGGLWGSIAFETRTERVWSSVDRNILRLVADSVGYALQRKRSSDDLNRALGEAERLAVEAGKASKATTDFLASISHEIRTPLNGLVGYAKLLRNTPLSQRQDYLLGGLDRSSEILLALINDLLDLSKISAGQFRLDVAPMLPENVVLDVIETLVPRAAEKGLKLACSTSGLPDNLFLGDERRLKQVLLNLVGNAVKFTSQGRIEITASAFPPPARAESWRIEFSVTDTGIGIDSETIPRLFQPFTQAGSDISRRFGGTGLGLAICRQLVTLMGGEIGVRSTPGTGSTFTFHVPAIPAGAPEKSVDTKPENARGTISDSLPLRIVIADDNLINQEVLSLYLEEMGYTPLIVDDGLAAFEAVKAQAVDLVFMDLRMPGMDGHESTRAIREWEASSAAEGRRRCVIIALTADALKSDQLHCGEAGMDDYVTKPIEPDKLEQLIRKHFLKAES